MDRSQTEQLIDRATAQIRSMGREMTDHIREAAAAVLEETQGDEGKPKLSIPVSITVDLAKSPPTFTVKLKVGVTRSMTSEGELQDPNQTEIDFS